MRIFLIHCLWFFSFLIIRVFSLIGMFWVLSTGQSIIFSIELFSLWSLDLKVNLLLDLISMCFSSVVLSISTVIIIYSYNYIFPYFKSFFFLWVTTFFVLSILIVIFVSNLLFAILGWDGLGLVRFFLIIYYQNQSSILSGVFTLLINRLGDRFFLFVLVLLFYNIPSFSFFSSTPIFLSLCFFLILTFITKRAIYPFSPWLPMAIAAPTPISALVHSSTLVTAGLFLIIRFRYFIYFFPFIIQFLMVFRIFTSFYAGLNAIFETDFKKLIALSTLRHLGFIALSFSSGLLYLRFFHLLVHAIFKSLLFIAIGDIIVNLRHSQDSRYLSLGSLYTPNSFFLIVISFLNLLGIPSLRGFFSKDLILEAIAYSNVSLFLEFFLYINVFFTYYYTYKLFYLSFRTNKLSPYINFHSFSFLHVILIRGLSIVSIIITFVHLNIAFRFLVFYPLPSLIKFVLLFLNFFTFIILIFLLKIPSYNSSRVFSFFSSILFLRNIAITISSNLYYSVLFNSVKSLEIGFLNFSINSQTLKSIEIFVSSLIMSLLKIQSRTIYSIAFFLIIIVISFMV